MKFRPLYDRILVKRAANETKTASGLSIPDNAQEKAARGEVLAVGEGRVLDTGVLRPLTVKPGDVVMLDKRAGIEVKLDGEVYLLLREDEVLGVLAS